MILEFRLDYRSSSQVYEKIFLRTLKELCLDGKILKEHFLLKLYVEADEAEKLEEFATLLARNLPHSIFLYNTEASIVDEMPEGEYVLDTKDKLSMPFCPKCAKESIEYDHPSYFDIFTECEVCGYGTKGESRSYKDEIQQAVISISSGQTLKINTHYGSYIVGVLSSKCTKMEFDVIAYDLATIMKYAEIEEYGIQALGSFEKPFVQLKTRDDFKDSFGLDNSDFVRFKLPDDMILHLLMEELHHLDIEAIYISKDKTKLHEELLLLEYKQNMEPIEVVASPKHIAIISGCKGLPLVSESKDPRSLPDMFNAVIEEHRLKHESIASINLSKEHKNNILVRGEKYGIIEYLSLSFTFDSIASIFKDIIDSDENGGKIILNYRKTYPEYFEKLTKIVFENHNFNIYRLWGIISIILNLSDTDDTLEAAEVLSINSMLFMGEKGPSIDYKLLNRDGKVYLDPLMTIRTAMSFKLAGVEPLTLSYGIVESFCEFLSNELDEVKQNMGVAATVVTGSLLGNRRLFIKLSKEASVNHSIYFANELPV
ncbi:MAG: hydrogenase [Sulfurovum sp.]|nr:hydrogenase [Sulfurovum sp.]